MYRQDYEVVWIELEVEEVWIYEEFFFLVEKVDRPKPIPPRSR